LSYGGAAQESVPEYQPGSRITEVNPGWPEAWSSKRGQTRSPSYFVFRPRFANV